MLPEFVEAIIFALEELFFEGVLKEEVVIIVFGDVHAISIAPPGEDCFLILMPLQVIDSGIFIIALKVLLLAFGIPREVDIFFCHSSEAAVNVIEMIDELIVVVILGAVVILNVDHLQLLLLLVPRLLIHVHFHRLAIYREVVLCIGIPSVGLQLLVDLYLLGYSRCILCRLLEFLHLVQKSLLLLFILGLGQVHRNVVLVLSFDHL